MVSQKEKQQTTQFICDRLEDSGLYVVQRRELGHLLVKEKNDVEKPKTIDVIIPNFLGPVKNYTKAFRQNAINIIYTAPSGEEGIKKLQDGLVPDVILMDIIMPEMDGFEMLEKMNTNQLSPNSIKIILSNKSQQEDIDRGNALGVAGYIVKANSTPMEVINQVTSILTKKVNPDAKSGSRPESVGIKK